MLDGLKKDSLQCIDRLIKEDVVCSGLWRSSTAVIISIPERGGSWCNVVVMSGKLNVTLPP